MLSNSSNLGSLEAGSVVEVSSSTGKLRGGGGGGWPRLLDGDKLSTLWGGVGASSSEPLNKHNPLNMYVFRKFDNCLD